MTKAEVDVGHKHTHAEIAKILCDFVRELDPNDTVARTIDTDPASSVLHLRTFKKLYGGFSGSNYRVDLSDGRTYVLKVLNGYDVETTEGMARVQHRLRLAGYRKACYALPMGGDSEKVLHPRFISEKDPKGSPACLLSWMDGVPCDRILTNAVTIPEGSSVSRDERRRRVLEGLGEGLAQMHAVNAWSNPALKTYKEGGACLVQEHVDGIFLEKINKAKLKFEDVANHSFVNFYTTELAFLREEMASVETHPEHFPRGIMHGDPFPDNALALSETGEFCGFVDFEDCCVGPLLFDVACCAIGTCFMKEVSPTGTTGETQEMLDLEYFRNFLHGYFRGRTLTKEERDHFVRFMRVALLCNCAWRFVNFNIDNREAAVAQPGVENAYLELQRRIEYLRRDGVENIIQQILSESEVGKENGV